MKMEQTECSETSPYKIQTPGNYPEENIQHTEHGESLKSPTYFSRFKTSRTSILFKRFFFPRVKWPGREVNYIPTSRLRMSGAIPVLPYTPSCRGQGKTLLRYNNLLTSQSYRGPGYCRGYSDSLQAGRSGDWIPVRARYSAPVQTNPGARAAYTVGT